MKVLFVASVYRHLTAFHIPYMQYFQSQGYEVWAAGIGEDAKEILTNLNIKCVDITFSRSPLSRNNIKALLQLKELFNKESFDLVHVHTPVASLLTRWAFRKQTNRKLIYTAHGFHFFKGAPIQNWLLYYPLEKIAAKWTDHLITINEEDYKNAQRFLNTEKLSLVHGVGVNAEDYHFDQVYQQRLKDELSIQKDSVVISYVAELNANKNHQFLLRNWKALKEQNPNVILLIIGTGEDEHKLKDYVEKLQLLDVHFLGFRKDIPQLLSISNIVTLLSHREGLPKSIMEAMAAGLPCVVTNTRGLRDLVVYNRNGFVVNHNDDPKLVEVFNKLIQSEQLRVELGEKTKDMVQPYFLDSVIKEYIAVYNKLLK